MRDAEREIDTGTVTFANFNPKEHSVYEIGGDVIPQIAEVFGHNLTDEPDVDNLGELIALVGPAKTLQDNIGLTEQRLGTDVDAVDLARNWVVKSGLLNPVDRSFPDFKQDRPPGSDFYVVTGGVANWMHRRADTLITEIECVGIQIGTVLLAGGNREMKSDERDDLIDGEREYMYLTEVIRPKLVKNNIEVEQVVCVNSADGNDVATKLVKYLAPRNPEEVTVVSNSGAWVQNAGQIGRAMVKNDIDPSDRLYVISDDFPLGTDKEPASTHQNPFSALGQIARNAQEFARWQS